VLGIDLGSEWIKLAVVQRSAGVQIVLNEATKRKSPNALSFGQESREFGDTAMVKPHLAIVHTRELLGKSYNEESLKSYGPNYFPYEVPPPPPHRMRLPGDTKLHTMLRTMQHRVTTHAPCPPHSSGAAPPPPSPRTLTRRTRGVLADRGGRGARGGEDRGGGAPPFPGGPRRHGPHLRQVACPGESAPPRPPAPAPSPARFHRRRDPQPRAGRTARSAS
jgi:hypothetical protein